VCVHIYIYLSIYMCVSLCAGTCGSGLTVCVRVHVYVQLTGSGDAYVGEVDYADGDHSANLKLVNPRVRGPPSPIYTLITAPRTSACVTAVAYPRIGEMGTCVTWRISAHRQKRRCRVSASRAARLILCA
jgi:hypothetical protein